MPLNWDETRYKHILESFHGYTFTVDVVDGQAGETHHSPGCTKVTGYSPAEYRADPALWYRMIHDADKSDVLAHIDRLKSGARVAPIEHRVIRKDGAVRWVRNTLVPRCGANGKLLGYDGLIYDITSRKQVEIERELLLAAEREQRLRAETMGEVFLALSAHMRLDHVLDEILLQSRQLVSFSAANIVLVEGDQLRIARWHDPQNHNSHEHITMLQQALSSLPLDAQAIQSQQPVFVPHTDLDSHWVKVPGFEWIKSFFAVPICLGEQTLGLLRLDSDTPNAFTAADVERLLPLASAAAIALENAGLYDRAQQELQERTAAEKALRHSANRNQAIFNAIPDSMLLFDPAGQLHHKNLTADDHPLHRFVAELSGRVPGRTDSANAKLVNRWQQQITRALVENEPQLFEFQLHSPPGNIQEYEARFICTGDSEVLVIVRNVTAQKQAERQARHAERLAALGQLAAALAHEINNPLQAIQSNLDLVLDYNIDPESTQQSLLFIREEIERLKDTTHRILNYARPQSEERKPVNLPALLDQVIMLANNQLKKSNVRLTTEFQPVPAVMAAPGQLIQVFLNLLLNTADLDDEQRLHLHVSVCPTAEHVVTTFQNSGPVIPPHMLDRLFEPFVTTKKEGTGLGLWISRTIILQHQGTFSVENIGPERGVRFVISLPIRESLS
ncbi:MAG: PAS domain S-box protein [Chloroflexi bacterium]|nr:MAG: PAS domain S-box protein [Chloroflexota bacterium]